MDLSIALAVLLAALLHATWNALLKSGTDPLLDTAAIVIGGGAVALPVVFFVPAPAPASWPYIAASALIHIAYYLLMVNAYRSGDLSLVYPLMRGTAPMITAVLGIFLLHEWPGALSWVGIALISLGVFALANAAVIAVYTIIDGRGARLAQGAWSYICWLFVVDALPFTLLVAYLRRGTYLREMYARRLRGLLGGGLSAAAYAISVWAMTKAPVALVASLRETSVLFAALIGARVLRERLSPRRWAGACAIVLGAL